MDLDEDLANILSKSGLRKYICNKTNAFILLYVSAQCTQKSTKMFLIEAFLTNFLLKETNNKLCHK